jgi:hypothetical protein
VFFVSLFVFDGVADPNRRQVLHLLVTLYGRLERPDYLHIMQCHVFGDNPAALADLLSALALSEVGFPPSTLIPSDLC